MTITLNSDYDVTLSTALLGYVGETNARPVSVEGMEIDGADRYVLTIDYGDGVTYEVDITGGQWTPTADILRSAQTISCQIAAKKLAGNEYVLVKKSRIFRLRIGAAIGDTAIPSPDVAMDALDRIDAIGRQTHTDMRTAVTAAETATTAAENAEKSATAAGLSADTATQAAERAETAKTAAETSATQAETAKQGAETARAEAVTAQNAAKISAAQASASAQQTTADKTATAGYAKTAKTNADSTAADRQAVQDMAAQVTADKATVADHATQIAEDRTAAETAAQTAQAVADSLPDDYVTAVGKIAENTTEINNTNTEVSELKEDLAYYGILDFEYENVIGKFFNAKTNSIENNQYYNITKPFEMNKGEKLLVTCHGYLDYIGVIMTCDDLNYTNAKCVSQSVDTTERNYEYEADKNTYVFVGYYAYHKEEIYPCKVKKIVSVIDLNRKIESNTDQINTNKSNIEVISNNAISGSWSECEYVKNNGKFVNATLTPPILSELSTYWYSDLIKLSKGDSIRVTSSDPSGSAIASISKWKSDGSVAISTIERATTDLTTVTYTATEDKEYIRFSAYKDSPFTAEVLNLSVPNSLKNVIQGVISEEVEKDTTLSVSMFSDIAVCGDSYTAGSINTRDGDVGTLIVLGYAPYGNMLARMTGVNVTTYASGGADTVNYQTRDDCLPKLLSDNPKDMYFFALGINDASKADTVPLGTITDIKSDYTQNANSFYGNYGKIIAQVKNHAPNAKIILSTVFIPTYSNGDFYNFSSNAIKEIAEHFEVMYVDTKEDSFMCSDVYNNIIRNNGGHPTAPAYSGIAKGVKRLIDKCIENNIEYFNSYIPNPLT